MKSIFLGIIAAAAICACRSPQTGNPKTGNDTAADNDRANAAGADSSRSQILTTDLSNTYWKLIELNGAEIVMSDSFTREPHLIVQIADSTIKGNGGCNGFGGRIEWKQPNRVKFSQIISTMMACNAMQVENQYFKALEAIDNYVISGDTLQLNKARMAPLAKFKAVYLK